MAEMIYESVIESDGRCVVPVEIKQHLGVCNNDIIGFAINEQGGVELLSAYDTVFPMVKRIFNDLELGFSDKEIFRIVSKALKQRRENPKV